VKRTVFAIGLIALSIAGCSESKPVVKPVDADLDLYNNTARLEFAGGSPTLAAAAYTKALNRARVIDDSASISTAAYNLAVAKAAMADYSSALISLDEADHETLRSGGNLADSLLVRSRVLLEMKRYSDSAAVASSVVSREGSKPDDNQKLQAWVVQGLAACAMKDVAAANHALSEARAIKTDPIGESAVLGLAGEVDLLSNNLAAAVEDFDKQAELARSAKLYRDMAKALAKSGRAAMAAGKPAVAADRLYRAARAATGRGEANAVALQAEALSAAQAAGDAELVKLIESLRVATTQQSPR